MPANVDIVSPDPMQNHVLVTNTSTGTLTFTGDNTTTLAGNQTKSLVYSVSDYVVTAKDKTGVDTLIATIKYPIDASSFTVVQGTDVAGTGFTAKLQIGSPK